MATQTMEDEVSELRSNKDSRFDGLCGRLVANARVQSTSKQCHENLMGKARVQTTMWAATVVCRSTTGNKDGWDKGNDASQDVGIDLHIITNGYKNDGRWNL